MDNPSVTFGDSSLYTREPLVRRKPPLCKGRWASAASPEGLLQTPAVAGKFEIRAREEYTGNKKQYRVADGAERGGAYAA